MNTYKKDRDVLGFEEADDKDTWVKFERTPNGHVIVDKCGEPRLTDENIAKLVKWLQQKRT